MRDVFADAKSCYLVILSLCGGSWVVGAFRYFGVISIDLIMPFTVSVLFLLIW